MDGPYAWYVKVLLQTFLPKSAKIVGGICFHPFHPGSFGPEKAWKILLLHWQRLPRRLTILMAFLSPSKSKASIFAASWTFKSSDFFIHGFKVEKILKGSLDLIPSPSLLVKIQIMGGKVSLRCKDKTLLGVVNKLMKTKSLLTLPSNVLPYYLK